MAEPGEDILQVGKRRYEQENSSFSYRNCLAVEVDHKVVGMMVAFPMESPDTDDSLGDNENDPVLVPYSKLEEYDSYYICGIAFFEEYRGQGMGKKLMALAEKRCQELALNKISLIVFKENVGALRLYEALGYEIVMEENVVAHPLIHFTGKACLMVKPLEE